MPRVPALDTSAPVRRRPIVWIIALFVGPMVLPFPLLLLGLVLPILGLVYASIAVSLLAIPCWIAAVVLLVRRPGATFASPAESGLPAGRTHGWTASR